MSSFDSKVLATLTKLVYEYGHRALELIVQEQAVHRRILRSANQGGRRWSRSRVSLEVRVGQHVDRCVLFTRVEDSRYGVRIARKVCLTRSRPRPFGRCMDF